MSAARPPRISRWLLATTVHADDRRFVLDDLAEGFEDRLRTDGLPVARRWYRQQVRRSIPACLADRWSRRRGMRLGDRLEDLRFAFRSLARTPIIALVAIVSLGLGLAAATSVFSVANAFLLRPPSAAVQSPDRLVTVFHSNNDGGLYGALSYQDYLDLSEQANSFADVAAHRLGIVRLGPVENSNNVMIEIVDGNYFDVLGVDMIRGRRFAPRETLRGAAERVTVISERLWRDRLGADPDIIGSDLLLEGKPHRVVGVAPRSLIGRFLALRVDAWVPIGIPGGTFRSTEKELDSRTEQNYGVVARLAEGVDMEAADAEAQIIGARLLDEHPEIWKDLRGQPRKFTVLGEGANRARPDMLAALGTASTVVLLAAGLLLAVACANVASVLLARADQRRGEIAVRLALGAGRRRLISMLLTESLLIGLTAGGLGILLTSWAVRSFDELALPIGDVRLEFDVLVDWRVMAFGALLAIATSIGFGLAPALQASRPAVADALRGAGSSGGTRVSRLRRALIVAQVAAALIFVIGSGMALDSFQELTAVNWGMDTSGIALMSLNAPEELAEADLPRHYRELVERLQAHPEVAAARIGTAIEGSAIVIDSSAAIQVPERATDDDQPLRSTFNAISPGYMETLGIRVIRGRSFSDADDAAGPRVAIVNEALARRLWPNESALGRRLTMQANGIDAEVAVVGIAAEARYQGFEDSASEFLWVPLFQHPARMYTLLLKGRGPAEAMVPILRGELDPAVPEIQLITPRTYATLITYQFAFIRILGQALAIAAGFGLLLAALGIYGVISFSVARRTREMAIRSALGAMPGQVVRLVVRDGARLTAWGMALGLLVIVPMSAALRSYVGDISTMDFTSVVGGAALLGLVAAIAALVPARRANAIDPVVALRED